MAYNISLICTVICIHFSLLELEQVLIKAEVRSNWVVRFGKSNETHNFLIRTGPDRLKPNWSDLTPEQKIEYGGFASFVAIA